MSRFYFPHMINIYGHPLENALMIFIAHHLTNDDLSRVENPNQSHHQEGYRRYAEKYKDEPLGKGTRGMRYFFEVVLPQCGSGSVSFAYLDGRLGLGVASEAQRFIESDLPSLLIEPTCEVLREGLERFTENPVGSDLFHIRPFSDEERKMLASIDPKIGNKLVVPHEQTRLRTFYVYGDKTQVRPLEEAHLAPTEIYPGFYPNK